MACFYVKTKIIARLSLLFYLFQLKTHFSDFHIKNVEKSE